MQSRRELVITIVLKNVRYKILNHEILSTRNKNKEQDNYDKACNKINLQNMRHAINNNKQNMQ